MVRPVDVRNVRPVAFIGPKSTEPSLETPTASRGGGRRSGLVGPPGPGGALVRQGSGARTADGAEHRPHSPGEGVRVLARTQRRRSVAVMVTLEGSLVRLRPAIRADIPALVPIRQTP